MKKFIMDTDIGDDIDDAFALHFALEKGLNLIGVTTTFRNTRQRAAIAAKLIALHGKDIPVYFGFSSYQYNKERCGALCQWTDDLENDCYSPVNSTPEEAVDYILDCARKYGKELYLIAIGPLCNVARAIEKDGAAMREIGGIYMMGGDYVNQYAEWNIFCDIPAADVVFSSGIAIVAFGHEVTSRSRLPEDVQNYVMRAGQENQTLAYLAELSRLWYASKTPGMPMVMHDVLVVRYALEPDYCNFASAPVAVEVKGEYTIGTTVNLKKYDLNRRACDHQILYATEVDMNGFNRYFAETIGYNKEEVL